MATIRFKWKGSRYVAAAVIVAGVLVMLPKRGDELHGEIVRVIDGDTFEVETEKGVMTVRLWGVDCPEMDQPWGPEAGAWVVETTAQLAVTVRVRGDDQWGRLVAEIEIEGVGDLGNGLITAGLAWWYVEYAKGDTVKRELQLKAREGKIGIWSSPNSVPPWTWRRGRRAETTPAAPSSPEGAASRFQWLSVQHQPERGHVCQDGFRVKPGGEVGAFEAFHEGDDVEQFVIEIVVERFECLGLG